jgi:CRP/FNR family transcriptional regulator, cyclic AMP receptor protein
LSVAQSDIVEKYADGEVIVREGDTGREMYIIRRGGVEVTKSLGGREMLLATLERGSFFGEMSLLESQPRSATVRAKGETELLVIEPGGLLLKIRRDPTFAFEMLQHMSRRVRDLDDRLMSVLSGARLSTEQVQAIRVSAITLGYLPPEAAIEATP